MLFIYLYILKIMLEIQTFLNKNLQTACDVNHRPRWKLIKKTVSVHFDQSKLRLDQSKIVPDIFLLDFPTQP